MNCATCSTFRHRHLKQGKLIETAEVERGKVEVVERKKETREEEEQAISGEDSRLKRLLRVPLRLCPA